MPPLFYLCVYWIPVLLCFILSFASGYQNYKRDMIKCHDEYYVPKFSVGRLLWLLLSPFIPIYNILVALFYVLPGIFTISVIYMLELWEVEIVKSKHKSKDTKK